MLLVKTDEENNVLKYPYTLRELIRDFPRTSFPEVVTEDSLEGKNVFIVEKSQKPSVNTYAKYVEDQAVLQENGTWLQEWSILNLAQGQAEKNVRDARNNLLSNSDWTQVNDAPVDQTAWATYRQELRDITLQAGFPYDIEWPTPPSE